MSEKASEKREEKSLRNLLAASLTKWFNKKFCAVNGRWNDYYSRAEQDIDV
jgi:hypothetical protein